MVENIIQIKSEIIMNVNGSAKSILYVKNIILGILLHAVANMENV